MKIRYFSAFVFKLLLSVLLVISLLPANAGRISAESHEGTVRITKISYIWFNGNPDRKAQPDNTFRYADGSTNGHTFTSKRRNANININYSDDMYSSAVRIKIIELNCLTGQGNTNYIVVDKNNYVSELTKLKISSLSVEDYVRQCVTEYYDHLLPWEMPPNVDIEADVQIVLGRFLNNYNIHPNENFSDATAKASGFGSWSSMIQTVKEQFYSREMGRLSVDGKTSWCIEPKVDRISSGSYVNSSSRLPSQQWALSASLIMSDALAKGAGKNDVNGNNYYFAAQTLIWELVDGLLDYETLNWKSSAPSGYYKGIIVGNKLEMYYLTLKEMVLAQRLDNIPSFLTSSYEYQLSGQIKTHTYPSKNVGGQLVPAEYMILYDRNGKVLDYSWNDTSSLHFEALDANHLKVSLTGSLEGVQTLQFKSQRVDIEASDGFAAEFISTVGQDQIVLGDWLYYNMTGYLRLTMAPTRKQDEEDGIFLLGDVQDTMVYINGGDFDGKTAYLLHDLPPFEQSGITYQISEAHAPVYSSDYIGYVRGNDAITVTITSETQDSWASEIWSGVLKDRRQKGRITLIKKVSPAEYESAEYLKGAVFGIYAGMDIVLADGTVKNRKGDLIEKLTTDESGKAVSSLLELGLYEIRELQAPFGTVINDQTYYADIKKGDENTEVIEAGINITNEIAGYISLHKIGYQFSALMSIDRYGYLISRPVFEKKYLSGVEFGIYAGQDFRNPNGSLLYEKDELIQMIITDQNGTASSRPLSEGRYYLVEHVVPEGYVLDQTRKEFEISGSSDQIMMDLGDIVNHLQKAAISLNKTFEGNNGNLKAYFGLYADEDICLGDGRQGYLKDQLIDILETEENGRIQETVELPYGRYYLRELIAPESYMLDYSRYPFEFSYSADDNTLAVIPVKPAEAELENLLERVTVKIVKYDVHGAIRAYIKTEEGLREISPEELLKGVYGEVIFEQDPGCIMIPDTEFSLYDSRGNLIETVVTDQKGQACFRTELAKGEYVLEETRANGNYLNREEVRFVIDDQQFDATLNFALADEGRPGICFIKTNRHGRLLEGCEITVFDQEGREMCKGISDEYGRLWFSELFPGKYSWRETKAPDGYQLDGEDHPFEITEEGEMIHVEINDTTDGTCRFSYDGQFHGNTVHTGSHDGVTMSALMMLFAVMALAATLVTERIRELQR